MILNLKKHALTRELLGYSGDVKSTETSDRNFTEIGLYLVHYSVMHCYIVSVLNIGLFQFSSKISVTCFCALHITTISQQLSR